MNNIIKSNDMSWLDNSNIWYNYYGIDDLTEALASANRAVTKVSSAGDIGSLNISVTQENLELLYENKRRLIYFCNAIHYEISEYVDVPFAKGMGELARECVALDPSDIKVSGEKKFLFAKQYSLTSVISAQITDDELKKDFCEKANTLDKDKVTTDLKASIEEANFWSNQFAMAKEIGDAADSIFTPQVRKNWENLTPDEKMELIERYKNQIGYIFGDDKKNITKKRVVYDSSGYGYSSPDKYISISMNFITNPTGMYSLDKCIDTLTHEMRHQYQSVQKKKFFSKLPESVEKEWKQAYISSNDPNYKYIDYYKQPVEEDAKAFAALSQDDD